jgi:hypothetical protein
MADPITCDFLILADAAQVQGEKLYMLGGGWTTVWAKTFPTQHRLAVAAGILVPWLETNTRHDFRIHVRTDEGTKLSEVGGHFEQGRSAGLPAGSTQRVMLTANLAMRFDQPCDVAAELWLDETLAKSVPFRVAQRPQR